MCICSWESFEQQKLLCHSQSNAVYSVMLLMGMCVSTNEMQDLVLSHWCAEECNPQSVMRGWIMCTVVCCALVLFQRHAEGGKVKIAARRMCGVSCVVCVYAITNSLDFQVIETNKRLVSTFMVVFKKEDVECQHYPNTDRMCRISIVMQER